MNVECRMPNAVGVQASACHPIKRSGHPVGVQASACHPIKRSGHSVGVQASACHPIKRSGHPVGVQASACRRPSGMTLLEVVLALAVFSIAALALVGTINQIAEAGLESQKLITVEQALETLIDEYGKVPHLRELDEKIKAGSDGVSYQVRIQEVTDIRNREGRVLQGMFRIQAAARWNDGGGPTEVYAETLRYAGAFLPVN